MLLWRLRISGSGHHDPVAADRRCYVVNAIDNRTAGEIGKDNITMTAHQLDDDLFGRYISELIPGSDLDMNDPLHAYLGDALNGSAFAVLAHQHAEHRRFRRIDGTALT
ncbi:hypothetical protein D3C81_1648040 [compost metagenome]